MIMLVDREYQARDRLEETIRQIVSSKQLRKTCAVLVIWDVDITKDCFATFRKLYRSVRESAIPGKLTIHKYETRDEILPQREYQDETMLDRMENKIAAKEWRSLPNMLRDLFAFWEKEQYDVYHIKMRIHQLTDLLQKNNALEHGKLVINEYLDDCIRYADSYEKMRDMVSGYLEKVLKNRNFSQQEGKNANQICAEIRQYVLQNESRNFSLNEICYLFKVSQPFIRKAFRVNTGMSYNEWVLDTKIQRAKELMQANPKLLVKDVAAQLGYEQLYFSTVFNKHVGMSPSEFKFRLQEASEEEHRE
jgi:YesN/AraC family two-component response regulator